MDCADPKYLPDIKRSEGEAKKRGVTYRSASGHRMEHLGELPVTGVTDQEGTPMQVTFQAAEVGLPIFSIPRVTEKGCSVTFGEVCGWIFNPKTKKHTKLIKRGRQYFLGFWVKKETQKTQPFIRQGKASKLHSLRPYVHISKINL